jgi:hypothetical protein
MSALFGDADRIAVIDVETTGLSNNDRVVEIAIVTLDAAGDVVDEFDTLINPMRDVGPSWIHGIDASMVGAVADHVVTDDEIDQLCRAAALLDLDLDLVTQRTDSYRTVSDVVGLVPGLEICFTGSAVDGNGSEIDRADLESLALRYGLVPKSSVTAKGCGLLVAADLATRSGKGDKAREHGISALDAGRRG